ncbi:MAG: flagellar motor switch protein FliN [Devosia sp.]
MSEPETKKPARAEAQRPSTGSSDPSAGKTDGQSQTQGGGADEPSIDTILRIPVVMQVVLGSATMPVANLMKLGRGQVVALDHRVGEPVDIVVNGRVIARGEVVVVDDDSSRFGVSLTEIVGPGVGAES